MLYPTSLGAITQLYAGTAPEAAQHNGKVRHSPLYYTFFYNNSTLITISSQ